MADSTIKPDSGNDLVLQNNGGTGKIEINDGADINVTIGSASGDDFNVGSGKLLVEGDNSDVSTTGTFKGNLTAGSGKTIDVSAGTLTLADNQISGNKVDGGDISGLNRVQSQIWTPSSGNTLYMGGNASASPMSNAPTFSASGFTNVGTLFVIFDPYIDTQSHRAHCYFTWNNESGSTKTFQIHFGRPHNACNFAFTLKSVGEYPSQSFRHYEATVATTSGDGTIFDSLSRELTEYQQTLGVWSSTGGTGDIIWSEPSNYVGNSTTWGSHFTFELGDTQNDSYTPDTITFKMV